MGQEVHVGDWLPQLLVIALACYLITVMAVSLAKYVWRQHAWKSYRE